MIGQANLYFNSAEQLKGRAQGYFRVVTILAKIKIQIASDNAARVEANGESKFGCSSV
jgi:hypothetical protein